MLAPDRFNVFVYSFSSLRFVVSTAPLKFQMLQNNAKHKAPIPKCHGRYKVPARKLCKYHSQCGGVPRCRKIWDTMDKCRIPDPNTQAHTHTSTHTHTMQNARCQLDSVAKNHFTRRWAIGMFCSIRFHAQHVLLSCSYIRRVANSNRLIELYHLCQMCR